MDEDFLMLLEDEDTSVTFLVAVGVWCGIIVAVGFVCGIIVSSGSRGP